MKPLLESMEFKFSQEGNCLNSSDSYEEITIKVLNDLGIDRDDGRKFFVIKTESWSFDNIDELKEITQRIERIL